jgi:glutamate---cysteine ligase / carboxylate-amine ligase
MVKELSEHYEAGDRLGSYPYEMLDENKWLAARHGLEGELVDLPKHEMVPAKALGRRLYDRLREHAQDLGGAGELEGIVDLLEKGTGAARQRVVYEANHDWTELLKEIVAATTAS